jgi:hypothetical protein
VTTAPAKGASVDHAATIGKVLPPISQIDAGALPMDGLHAVIASAAGAAQKHVIVDDCCDLAKIESLFPGAIVWHPGVFQFYLSFLDPLEYFALLRERTVFYGKDPLREEFALGKSALRDTVCHYSADMLTYPYRAALAGLSDGEFQNIVYGWYLRTLRYFEDGFVDFDYYSLRQYFKNRHPDSLLRFPLLHGIAGDLSNHLRA